MAGRGTVMIRPLCVPLAAFVLFGCGIPAFIDRHWPDGGPPSVSAARTSGSALSPGATARNARCDDLAKSRAADAAANGYDDDIQKAVHDGSYADCVSWQSAHPGGD
jgi:hypothetical protein